MTYIHEQPDWPNLHWDSQSLAQPLAALRHKQGRYLGRMETLGFQIRAEASLVSFTDAAVTTSAIEGEHLASEEVRSSVARHLGMDTAGLPSPSRAVDGVVAMMIDATEHHAQALTAERLWAWHQGLFPDPGPGRYPIQVGAWRDGTAGPMQVVSGPLGRERVHFQAPEAERLAHEMQLFIDWFNASVDCDPVLKAAVAHLWFVTIHPFDDGNGRIGRAIADMALARGDGLTQRFYSMSVQCEAERKDYYQQLELAQRGTCDISRWVAWFIGCVDRCLDTAEARLQHVLRKAALWQRVQDQGGVNPRQHLVLTRMLEPEWQGHLTNAKFAKLGKCSADTALRDLRDLLKRGLVRQNPGGGRSTSYRLAMEEGD